MTTAGRATHDTAKGGKGKWESDLSAMSRQISVRDLPSHQKMKYRKEGQGRPDEIRERNLKREFEEKEKVRYKGIGSGYNDRNRESDLNNKRLKMDKNPNIDKDDNREYESEESSSDSEDDEQMLQAELMKIKEEKLKEKAKMESEKKEKDDNIRLKDLAYDFERKSNNFNVKRRWDDDVIFKNCAKGEIDCSKRGFINDTLRSEFHKKFMNRYIQ